jgi:aldehyde:ferredoxin oxidoreductase
LGVRYFEPIESQIREPVKSGALKRAFLQRSEWDRMLDEYYDLHGWDRQPSWPTKEKLMALGLHEWVERLGNGG